MTAATPGMSPEVGNDSNELCEPAGGAGLFDVDPDQRGVSQDPGLPIIGDAEALAEDLEL